MKEYRLGSRFFKGRNLCLLLTEILVFCFYFIYDYVFSSTLSWWNGTWMAAVFLLVGAVFFGLIWAGADKIYQNVSYSLSDDSLICTSWGRSRQYPFHSFRQAALGLASFSSTLPAVFELEDGKTLQLNQYIGELPELTAQLLLRIEPFARIDPQLKDYVSC